MSIINITIRNKIAQNPTKEIVCGNSDYVVYFDFDEEWASHTVKTARFVFNGKFVDVVFEGNTVNMPVVYDAITCAVGVFAGDLATTTPAIVRCKKSILCDDGVPADPPEDVYNQIMELISNGGGSGGGGNVELPNWELDITDAEQYINFQVPTYINAKTLLRLSCDGNPIMLNDIVLHKLEKDVAVIEGLNYTHPTLDGMVTAAAPIGWVKQKIADALENGGTGSGTDGKDGATFTPSVSEDGTLLWTNDKGLENPAPFNIVNAVIDVLPKYNGEVEQV